MKKVLFRKLLIDYLSFFFVALMSTSIVIWVFQAVNFLDIMIEDGRDYLVYVNFSLLNFPKIVSKVFPFALFFSLFYVTSKSELNILPEVRRSIVVKKALPQEHILVFEDLAWVRPGGGFEPGREFELVGKRLSRAVGAGQVLCPADFQ